MRVKVNCKLTSTDNVIGYNYNFALSALIYRMLARHDFSYSRELHEGRGIKHFTFSPIEFRKAGFGRKITMEKKRFSFILSSSRDKLIEAFLNYDDQKHLLVTPGGSIRFKISEVELSKPVITGNTFRLLSPLAINIRKNGKEYFLAPHEEGYSRLLFENLIKKAGKQESDYNPDDFRFEVLSKNPQSKFINHVKGYLYDFKIICPKELIKVGVVDGFGVKNSQGFGFVK